MKTLILIDNFDSFTFNLAHLFAREGLQPRILRSDASLKSIREKQPCGLIIGPGPDDPQRSGVSMAALQHFYQSIPILGICLGMQCMAELFGGRTIRSRLPVHGKTSRIHHDGSGILRNIPNPFTACRYHSLCVELPDTSPLHICARSEDGTPMALVHQHLPVFGLQFHPESFMSEHGAAMARHFLQEMAP
ncbi:aminodeoxychorismate/anthranilate synthase component II [Desulfobotulus sp. H1]|uniref:Aminodeoxychorismate/anthranilate synthase component II n=1 Tax=Desulfobotulus pelophilus TaxID=2823377 RepID=A0ABT3NBH2_9BACT|nr:aminodeoxychorismate/anthranilate synthase component II [Desulfobotulus pelophilus]MCW7754814.1 aminodeoxychorismate/anthranilate synthase component II [Desulfobotulus pelophilus]